MLALALALADEEVWKVARWRGQVINGEMKVCCGGPGFSTVSVLSGIFLFVNKPDRVSQSPSPPLCSLIGVLAWDRQTRLDLASTATSPAGDLSDKHCNWYQINVSFSSLINGSSHHPVIISWLPLGQAVPRKYYTGASSCPHSLHILIGRYWICSSVLSPHWMGCVYVYLFSNIGRVKTNHLHWRFSDTILLTEWHHNAVLRLRP